MGKDGHIHEKFVVARTDGTHIKGGKHHECFYWVLDVDHDPYALPALEAYATACRATHPTLAGELRKLVRERKEVNR